jgi:hypothetical protein
MYRKSTPELGLATPIAVIVLAGAFALGMGWVFGLVGPVADADRRWDLVAGLIAHGGAPGAANRQVKVAQQAADVQVAAAQRQLDDARAARDGSDKRRLMVIKWAVKAEGRRLGTAAEDMMAVGPPLSPNERLAIETSRLLRASARESRYSTMSSIGYAPALQVKFEAGALAERIARDEAAGLRAEVEARLTWGLRRRLRRALGRKR